MSEDDDIAESVRRHGWHAIAVEETESEPPFVYTIGLCDTLAHPELIVVGLPPRTGHGVLSNAVAAIRSGRAYRAGQKVEGLIANHVVELLPVHPTHHVLRMGYALGYYRREGKPDALRALQVRWPDRAGHLPSDPRCEEAVARWQPRLDLPVPPDELRAFFEKYGGR